MSMVMFAQLCDKCGKRSEEYTAWPTCEICQEDTCPDCALPGTTTEPDVDSPVTCVCVDCEEEGY